MRFDVVSLGILVADLLAVPVEEYPGRGKLVLTERMTLNMGGCTANAAVGMTRLGLKVGVIGKVGKDGLGSFVVRALEEEGVNTEGIREDEEAGTSATMVMVHPGGERSFIHYTGANGRLREEDVDFGLVKDAKVLGIGGVFLMPGFDGPPLARVVARGKEMGAITVLDTAWDATGQWM